MSGLWRQEQRRCRTATGNHRRSSFENACFRGLAFDQGTDNAVTRNISNTAMRTVACRSTFAATIVRAEELFRCSNLARDGQATSWSQARCTWCTIGGLDAARSRQSWWSPARMKERPCLRGAWMQPIESLVCSVLNTRWPVIAACTAICMFLRRGFRPRRMMSGS